MSVHIAMIGAGSGFTIAIVNELIKSSLRDDCRFVLMDPDEERLGESDIQVRSLVEKSGATIEVIATTDLRDSLTEADFVITSFAPQRNQLWQRDIQIAQQHGIELLTGENGGPAGQFHALRNITILMKIVEQMRQCCPNAVLLNFTNPMSILCTYLHRHTDIRWMGFCHQVHGSFGVIAEMLGMEPGELEVITAGINHMNFLLDIRRKGENSSWMDQFAESIRKSKYWREIADNVPEQRFTLEFFDAFGVYPVGYDSHICEYLPFFYSQAEWSALSYRSTCDVLNAFRKLAEQKTGRKTGTLQDVEVWRQIGQGTIPFPKDVTHPHYKETPIAVIESLLTNRPLYMDAMVTVNHGCVSNLPRDAVVDIPVTITGGRAHGLEVGALPRFAAELCRRQITIHELIADAAVSGDQRTLLEAMCLDPYVHSLTTARKLVQDYLDEYAQYLPQFQASAT